MFLPNHLEHETLEEVFDADFATLDFRLFNSFFFVNDIFDSLNFFINELFLTLSLIRLFNFDLIFCSFAY